MPATSTVNEQVIEAVVSGPGTANRLFTCTGQAQVNMQASPQERRETWTFLVGPALPQRFLRATASVSVAGYGIYLFGPTDAWYNLAFESVEADWDDESGRTEMRVEVEISTGSIHYNLAKIGYEATVLAELPTV